MCATHTYLLFAKRNSATQTQVLLEHKGKKYRTQNYTCCDFRCTVVKNFYLRIKLCPIHFWIYLHHKDPKSKGTSIYLVSRSGPDKVSLNMSFHKYASYHR